MQPNPIGKTERSLLPSVRDLPVMMDILFVWLADPMMRHPAFDRRIINPTTVPPITDEMNMSATIATLPQRT